jgi:hypothetical protein
MIDSLFFDRFKKDYYFHDLEAFIVRIWKSSLLIIGLCVLVLSSMTAVAETVTDGTGDIYHWYWNADSGTFGWLVSTDEKPNIDITELSYTISGETATFVMKVAGNIEDTQYISYWATYTSDEVTYFYTYANGEVFGMASNSETTLFDMEAEVTVSGDTLTIEFDSVGEGIANLEFYGHAHIWTETGGESGESWWDYAPDTYFGGDISDDDTGGDDTGGDGDGDEDGGTPPPTGTPGFETLAVIAALGVAFIILRRKK